MKHLIKLSLILLPIMSFSQNENKETSQFIKQVKFESFNVTVTINSAKELEDTFKIEDIIEIINSSDENQDLSFEIICNSDALLNNQKSYVAYKIEGKSDKKETFLKQVEKIRSAAISYYKSNNK